MEKTNILIVDDEPKVRDFLDRLLKAHDYQTLLAADGQEAIDEAVKHHPHLIIMDIMLPDMNGGEAVLAIQKKISHDIPVIFLSGIAEKKEQDGPATITVGNKAYPSFPKPLQVEEFLEAIRNALQA